MLLTDWLLVLPPAWRCRAFTLAGCHTAVPAWLPPYWCACPPTAIPAEALEEESA